MEWTEEQNEEFASAVDEAGAGIDAQVDAWLPVCVLTEDFDIDSLTSLEMYEILRWIRGDEDPEGAIPLVPSSEYRPHSVCRSKEQRLLIFTSGITVKAVNGP